MADRKRHHFVPQCYLRLFSRDQKRIGVYNIDRGLWIETASIRDQAYVDYFYGRDKTIETALSKLETKARPILSRIVTSKDLPSSVSPEYQILLLFVLTLTMRTESAYEEQQELEQKLLNIMGRTPQTKTTLRNAARSLNNAAFRMAVAISHLDLVRDLACKLLLNESQVGFLTSDTPVVRYNQFLEDKRAVANISNIGVLSKGLQLMIPISSNAYLIFYDSSVYKVGDKKEKAVRLVEKDVDQLNLLQAINANQNLYFRPQSVRHGYVQELVERANEFRRQPLVNVEEYIATDGSNRSLIHIYRKDVRIKLRLSCVSFTKRARKYEPDLKVLQLRNEDLLPKEKNAIKEFDSLIRQGNQGVANALLRLL